MLELLNLDKQLSKAAYSAQMEKLQESLRLLQYDAQKASVPVVVCIEGWNGSGRGEIVKKLSEKLDPRLCRFRTFVSPTPLEQRYHFLWRYQVALPNDGEMTVFDHSWYGRVLVERCERLVKKKVWRQAYQQINEFERWLADDGQVLVKFWLHISKKEQRRRFRAWKRDPLLRVKLTKEYRRQHRQYGRWLVAVEEMLQKTGTSQAPWTVVEAHDMRWARVRVFEALVKRIQEVLERRRAHPESVSRAARQITAAAGQTSSVPARTAAPTKRRATRRPKAAALETAPAKVPVQKQSEKPARRARPASESARRSKRLLAARPSAAPPQGLAQSASPASPPDLSQIPPAEVTSA